MKNNRLQLFLKKRLLQHILFWIAYLVISIGFYPQFELKQSLIRALITMIAISLPVYINLIFLVPRLLEKERYKLYGISTLILLIPSSIYLALISLYFFESTDAEDFTGMFAYSIFHVFSILFISSCLKLAKNWFTQQGLNRELEHEKLKTELAFLKSQVNPHFLFNTLNNIYALAMAKSDRAPEIILKLATILRYMLYECNESRVFLNREIEYLKNYIELEEIRMGGRGTILLSTSGDTDRKKMAPLLFTPFLENAIKHGLNTTGADAWIKMKIKVSGNDLLFEISNSKGSRQAHNLNKSSGIGLQNVRRRLELSYPDKHEVRIRDEENSYIVSLKIDLSA